MKYRFLLPIGLTAAFILSIVLLCTGNLGRERTVAENLNKARELASSGMVVDAVEFYGIAFQIRPSEELAVETARVAGTGASGIEAARYMEDVLEKYPKSTSAYEYLFELYYGQEDYPSFFSLYDKYCKRKLQSTAVDDMYAAIAYSFYLIGSYDEVADFCDGCCAVRVGGKWGYVDAKGSRIIEPVYDVAEPFANGRARVTTESGEAIFIDREGKKRIEPAQYSPRADKAAAPLKAARLSGGVRFEDANGNNALGAVWRDAHEFNARGCAFVNDGESWKLLKLYQFNH